MESLPSVRMTANLNSLIMGRQRIEQAERAIVGADVAHHVVDPDGVLGLDPLQAADLDEALELLRAAERAGLVPRPARCPARWRPLRGPAAFNLAALEQGEAVVASSAGTRPGPAPGRRRRAVAGVRGRAALRADQPVRRRAGPERGGARRRRTRCAGWTSPPAHAPGWAPPRCSLPATAPAGTPPRSGPAGCSRPATLPCPTTAPASRRSRPAVGRTSCAGYAPAPARPSARR